MRGRDFKHSSDLRRANAVISALKTHNVDVTCRCVCVVSGVGVSLQVRLWLTLGVSVYVAVALPLRVSGLPRCADSGLQAEQLIVVPGIYAIGYSL